MKACKSVNWVRKTYCEHEWRYLIGERPQHSWKKESRKLKAFHEWLFFNHCNHPRTSDSRFILSTCSSPGGLQFLQPWAGAVTDMRPAALLDWVSSVHQPTGVHWEASQSLILWGNLINPCVYFLLVLWPENYVSHINIISMCSIKIDMLKTNTKRSENVSSPAYICNPSTWKTKPGGLSRVWSSWGLYNGAPGYPELEWGLISRRKKKGKKRGWVSESPPPQYGRKYLQLMCLTWACIHHPWNTQLPSKNNTLFYRQKDLNRYFFDSECRLFVITNSTPTDTWHNYSPGKYKSIIKRNHFPFTSMAAIKTQLSHCVCEELVPGHSLHSQMRTVLHWFYKGLSVCVSVDFQWLPDYFSS